MAEPAPAVSFTNLSANPGEPPPARPIYKRWWFWAGVGAVVILGAATASAATRNRPLTCVGQSITRCEQL